MAKRKLSPQQRETIRKEIRALVKQGRKQADVLRAMAEKYHITPITARWYYKSVVRPGRPAPKNSSGRRIPRGARRPQFSGSPLRIVQQVQSAEKNFKRVLEAKKLIPKWQIYVRQEALLRKEQDKVVTKLREVSLKASALQRKIRALTSG